MMRHVITRSYPLYLANNISTKIMSDRYDLIRCDNQFSLNINIENEYDTVIDKFIFEFTFDNIQMSEKSIENMVLVCNHASCKEKDIYNEKDFEDIGTCFRGEKNNKFFVSINTHQNVRYNSISCSIIVKNKYFDANALGKQWEHVIQCLDIKSAINLRKVCKFFRNTIFDDAYSYVKYMYTKKYCKNCPPIIHTYVKENKNIIYNIRCDNSFPIIEQCNMPTCSLYIVTSYSATHS